MAPKCTRPPRTFHLLGSLFPRSDHFTIYLPIAEFLRGTVVANGGSSPTFLSGMPAWQVWKLSRCEPSMQRLIIPSLGRQVTAGHCCGTPQTAGHLTPSTLAWPEAFGAWRLVGAESGSLRTREAPELGGGKSWDPGTQRVPVVTPRAKIERAYVTPQRARRVSAASSEGAWSPVTSVPTRELPLRRVQDGVQDAGRGSPSPAPVDPSGLGSTDLPNHREP